MRINISIFFFFITRSFFINSAIVAVVEKPTFISVDFMKLSLLDRPTFFRLAPLMHFIDISGLIARFMVFLMILNKLLYKYGTMGSSVWELRRHGCMRLVKSYAIRVSLTHSRSNSHSNTAMLKSQANF